MRCCCSERCFAATCTVVLILAALGTRVWPIFCHSFLDTYRLEIDILVGLCKAAESYMDANGAPRAAKVARAHAKFYEAMQTFVFDALGDFCPTPPASTTAAAEPDDEDD